MIDTNGKVPQHVAIIMDGNGRWAQARNLPRVAGHKKGLDAVRATIEACARSGVSFLTVFAFSSENWRRPEDEVGFLMRLFMLALEREVDQLSKNNIRLRVVGDLSAFDAPLRDMIAKTQVQTAHNTGLCFTIAANYGGRWDILQSFRRLVVERPDLLEQLAQPHANLSDELFSEQLSKLLAMDYAPEPDLFIRTGGEKRISNFMLWQLAYTELYFTDVFWPDFDHQHLAAAFAAFASRERRFGMTSAQVQALGPSHASSPEMDSSCSEPASSPR